MLQFMIKMIEIINFFVIFPKYIRNYLLHNFAVNYNIALIYTLFSIVEPARELNYFSRYFNGEIPVCFLKYRQKKDGLGKLSSSEM